MYPNEYIRYLVHFHGDRDYFECHEILEEYWKKQDTGNKLSVWVGFIQLAVSCYHHRRKNYTGARRTLEKAINIFIKEDKSLDNLGLETSELLSLLSNQIKLIEKKQAYKSLNLPIHDPFLLQECQKLCSELGFNWCTDSDEKNSSLVHRHKLRDRSKIIEERIHSMKMKKSSEST